MRTTTPLGRLAALTVRRRRAVLAAWLVALVAAIGLGIAAGGAYSVDYSTPGSGSERAAGLLDERFADRSEDTADIVWTSPDGALSASVRPHVERVLAGAAGLEGLAPVPSLADAERSADGRTAVLRLAVEGRTDAIPESTGERLRELAGSSPVEMAVAGGAIPGIEEEPSVSSELIGLAVALLVLLITFGSLVAAGLPLLTALFGLGVGASLFGVLAALTDMPDWAPQVGTMIGLGVGIDYALLIVTRHRAALAGGASVPEAIVEATATAGRSVLVAGSTVVVAMSGLFLVGLPYLYGVALAAMLAVLIVMAASVTLLPALLAMFGRRIERLRVPGARGVAADPERTPTARWARGVQRRPVLATVAGVVLLAVLTVPVADLRLGFPDAGNDAEGTTTRAAYELIDEGFGPGANGPLVAVAETPAGTDPAAVDRLAGELRAVDGVAAVAAPEPSQDGSASAIVITPTTGPQDRRTFDLIHDLRDGPLAAADELRVSLGGQTAATVDQGEATLDRLPVFIGGVLGLSLLLLLGAFRAPLLAVKAGALNLLSIAAAYGIVALVAQGGWAGELVGIHSEVPVPPFIPVLMFAVLFGLSMDYEVFLLSRIREERARLGSSQAAVVSAVARTGPVITAAALIMVAVFGAFALSPDVFLKLIGIGLASAVLLDATIVRMILVPAVMALLGERAWWAPRWLRPQRLTPVTA